VTSRPSNCTLPPLGVFPGGLPRAERELASTVVSRINGCVYCASVHAQRFGQLAKRTDAIEQVFEDPASAGTTERERAIIRYAIELTEHPEAVNAEAIKRLKAHGLTEAEILDLTHAIAIFAWANRLMLTLGEPVFPAQTADVEIRNVLQSGALRYAHGLVQKEDP
jgi:uncharacterized peroxidase-related enzyme